MNAKSADQRGTDESDLALRTKEEVGYCKSLEQNVTKFIIHFLFGRKSKFKYYYNCRSPKDLILFTLNVKLADQRGTED